MFSCSGKYVFEKTSSDALELKCSASEALSVYGPLRLYMLGIEPTALPETKVALASFYALCNVMDLLLALQRGSTTPQRLHAAVTRHLTLFRAIYEDAWIPKCHFAVHLAGQLGQHGFLLSCFVHKRKHKEIKGMPTS